MSKRKPNPKKPAVIEVTKAEHNTIDRIIGILEDNPLLMNCFSDKNLETLETLRAKMVRVLYWKF